MLGFLLILIFPLTASAEVDTITVTVTIEQIVAGVVSAPPDQSGDPGDILVYTFTVQNTGNGPDTFGLKAKSSERWPVNLPGGDTTGILAAGEAQAVDVELSIPSDEIVGTQDTLTLTATSQTDKKISGSDSVLTTVNQVAGVLVTAPKDKTGSPGQTITYNFTVQNTGNGEDNFDLEAASSQGWLVSLPDGDTTGTLQPAKTGKASTKVTVELTIPSDAPAGTSDELTLMATSQFDTRVSAKDSVTTTVTTRKRPSKDGGRR